MINLFLGGPGHHLIFLIEQTVFVELIALVNGDLAQGDVMVLGAGKVLEGGAVTLRRDHPQIHIQALAMEYGGFCRPLAVHLDHLGLGNKKFHNLCGLRGDHQEIQIPDGLLHPPQGPGHIGPLHFWPGPQGGQNLVGQR